MTTKKVGWGLIGTGKIADDRILPGINAFAGNELVAVVSREQSRADAFARKFGARHAYTNYADMLANPDVHVVAIHTPNDRHADEAVAAARAGKHVFCDKPMATTVADAERIVRECEKAGVKLAVNFHNRFMPCFIEIKRIIDSGEIGEVLLVQLEASPGARPGGTLSSWRTDPVAAGLGTSNSIGVHVFDILRFLLSDEVTEVTSLFDTPRNVMEQIALSIVRFGKGAMAQLTIHEIAPYPHNDIVIQGSKGRITGRGLTRSRSGGVMEVLGSDGKTRTMEFPAINAHGACIAAFSAMVRDNLQVTPSGIDGLRSVQLTEAMAKSAWDKITVRLAS